MVLELKEEGFEQRTSNGMVMIDFYADWCGPCQMMKPVFEKVSKDFKAVGFYKVNVDEAGEIAQKFEVRSIPTILFLKNGEEVDRLVGVSHEEDFKKRITKVFK